MARRFEAQYRVKRQDNLGDPEFWNRRWDDIDRRMHARELDATKIDDAADTLEAVALARLNDQLTPIIAQAVTRLTDLGLLFSANSHTERTMQTGVLEFTVDEEMRESFVATGFLILRPVENLAIGMSARTLSYNPATGLLTVDAYSTIGAGTFDAWSIGVTGDPDLAHATRTDNPHATTAAQVGAYTEAETDTAIGDAVAAEATARASAITAAINAVVGTAPLTLDTLGELAAALGNDPTFAITMVNALANATDHDGVNARLCSGCARFNGHVREPSPLRYTSTLPHSSATTIAAAITTVAKTAISWTTPGSIAAHTVFGPGRQRPLPSRSSILMKSSASGWRCGRRSDRSPTSSGVTKVASRSRRR